MMVELDVDRTYQGVVQGTGRLIVEGDIGASAICAATRMLRYADPRDDNKGIQVVVAATAATALSKHGPGGSGTGSSNSWGGLIGQLATTGSSAVVWGK
jgi:hypothetical protein